MRSFFRALYNYVNGSRMEEFNVKFKSNCESWTCLSSVVDGKSTQNCSFRGSVACGDRTVLNQLF